MQSSDEMLSVATFATFLPEEEEAITSSSHIRLIRWNAPLTHGTVHWIAPRQQHFRNSSNFITE